MVVELLVLIWSLWPQSGLRNDAVIFCGEGYKLMGF